MAWKIRIGAELLVGFVEDLLKLDCVQPDPTTFLIVELGVGEHLMEVVSASRDSTVGSVSQSSLDLTHRNWFGDETERQREGRIGSQGM